MMRKRSREGRNAEKRVEERRREPKLKPDPNLNNTPEASFVSHTVQGAFNGNFHVTKAQLGGTHLDDRLLVGTWKTLKLPLGLLPLPHHLHKNVNFTAWICFSPFPTTEHPQSFVAKRPKGRFTPALVIVTYLSSHRIFPLS